MARMETRVSRVFVSESIFTACARRLDKRSEARSSRNRAFYRKTRVAVRPIRIGTAARFVCVTLYVSRDRLEAR